MRIKGIPRNLLLLYILAVSAAISLAIYKFYALAYHTDFSFYMQFAAKLLDPELSKRYTYNASGHNFFGLTGMEGEYGFHPALHFEPVKYIYALVYRLLGGHFAVMALYALLYFLPVLYFARVKRAERLPDKSLVYLFAAAYIAFPSTFMAVNNDLRPRMLFNAAIPLVLFAVHFRRPLWERAGAFLLLFLLREESLMFALPLIGYNYLRADDPAEGGRSTRVLAALWLLAAGGTAAFYIQSGYTYDPRWNSFTSVLESPARMLLAAALGIGLFWGISYARHFSRRRQGPFPNWLVKLAYWAGTSPQALAKLLAELAVFALLLAPIAGQFLILMEELVIKYDLVGRRAWLATAANTIIYSEHLTIFCVVCLLGAVLLWEGLPGERRRSSLQIALVLVVIAGAVLTAANFEDMRLYWGRSVQQTEFRPEYTQEIFDLRAVTDKASTAVLTDYQTYQAFYDYERAFIFRRLPWFLLQGDARLFPANRPELERLLLREIEFIAIAQDESADLLPLVEGLGLKLEQISAGERYVVYALVRE